MIDISQKEIWFVVGSQELYGEETLRKVAEHSQIIAQGLDASSKLPVKLVYKDVVKSPAQITNVCLEANSNKNCIGIVAWMHTFSPAKMWIGGLSILNKPLCHLHTQFNAEILGLLSIWTS